MNLRDALPERRGHFLLESGYHSATWLTLDALFEDPAALAPLVGALADRLRAYAPAAVCGPMLGGAFLAQAIATELGTRFYYTEAVEDSGTGLFAATYRLPPALAAAARGQRVAVVDDAISAGSSVRATLAALADAGASTVAIGSLLVLGDAGWDHFAAEGVPVETLERREFELWKPSACPLCDAGVHVVDPR